MKNCEQKISSYLRRSINLEIKETDKNHEKILIEKKCKSAHEEIKNLQRIVIYKLIINKYQ